MRNRKGTFGWVLAGVLVAATAIGLGVGSDPALAGEAVKLGVLMPVSGTLAYDGGLTIDGIKLAAEEINAGGGIDGKMKIDLVVEDSAGLPGHVGGGHDQAGRSPPASAVVGDFASSCTLASMEVAKRERVPLVTRIFLPRRSPSRETSGSSARVITPR